MSADIYMPSAADFNALILGISYILYDGLWLPARATYDAYRDRHWPTAKTLLLHLDYTTDATGWREFMTDTVGGDVIDRTTARIIAIDRRRLPPTAPGPGWGDELALTLDYEWPWNGHRERRDAIERGWI
jgi:hypothetical protein